MIGIYKITSPSNKIYIGQSWDIEKRFESYKKYSCAGQVTLYNSLLKYGFFAHRLEILETAHTTIQLILDNLEKKWFFFYKNQGFKMLNIMTPGKGAGRHSESTKAKIALSKYKLISQFDKEGNFIRYWISTSIASKELGISYSVIKANLSGKTQVCSNRFIFKKGEYDKNIKIRIKERKKRETKRKRQYFKSPRYPILQFSLDNIFIKEWDNCKVAAHILGLNKRSISAAARGEIRKSGGFIWKWKNK